MKVGTYRSFATASRASTYARLRDNGCVVQWPDGKWRVHIMDVTGRPVVYGPAFGEAKDWDPATWWVPGVGWQGAKAAVTAA